MAASDDYIRQLIRERAEAYGLDPNLLSRVAKVESSYNPRSGARTSSAKGLFQFTNPTWARYGQGRNVYDPYANADAGARFTAENIRGLQGAGHDPTPANVYLAHFAGLGGANNVLSADPSTPVSRVLSPQAIRANPFLRGMRVSDLRQWAAAKMGGLLDPAEPTSVAQLRSPPTSLTASTIGIDPADRAALQPWYTRQTPLPEPTATPGTAPALPAPLAVARAAAAPASYPGPAGPPGVPVAQFDPTYMSPPETRLNPADRARLDQIYGQPGGPPPVAGADTEPAPVVTAQAPAAPAPVQTPVTTPAPAAAIPPPDFPGAAGATPTPVPTVTAGPQDMPKTRIGGPPVGPETAAANAAEGAATVHSADEGELPGLLQDALSSDKANNLAELATLSSGILNQGLATPELGSLTGVGTMSSPMTQMVKQFRQQKLASDLQKLKSIPIPGVPQQEGTA